MSHLDLLNMLISHLKVVRGVNAIVLGGSWASGAQRPDSDIDIALYYQQCDPLDISHIRAIADELNDTPDPVVTELGGWGRWVNGGAWLTIEGQRVDFLYRDIHFVASILEDCRQGNIEADYWQQPPYGFYSYMYCTETHICKPLYDPEGIILWLKTMVEQYPPALKTSIINTSLWSAHFTLENAQKMVTRDNTYFVTGCITRIAACLVQVLYALNERFFISEKQVYNDIERFARKPELFMARLDQALGAAGSDVPTLQRTLQAVAELIAEVERL